MATKFTVELQDEKTGRIYIPSAVRKHEQLKRGDILEITVENLSKKQ